VGENKDAIAASTISDVAIGAGLAVGVLGVYLLLTAPSEPLASSALRFAPLVGRERVGVAVERAW
jgi:hypothetical protein